MGLKQAFVLGVVAAMLPLAAAPAHAITGGEAEPSTVAITADEEAIMRSFFDEMGVDRRTQEALILKVKAGEALLADDPEAEPVRTRIRTVAGGKETVNFFADGSVAVMTLEAPKATSAGASGITPMGINSCTVTRGSGYAYYKNCKVHWRNAVWSYWFTASFTIVTGGRDQLNHVDNCAFGYTIGYTTRLRQCGIMVARESAGGDPAQGQMQFDATTNGKLSTTHTRTLGIKVGRDSFWMYP